jgi:cation diffusion facilitator CzcD-associated flavoprotein CzcO
MTRPGDAMTDRARATNVSLWESPYPARSKQVPPKFAHVEACVIGAGIAGLTTAYLLAKEGIKVLVLEEREIGGQILVLLHDASRHRPPQAGLDHRQHHLGHGLRGKQDAA